MNIKILIISIFLILITFSVQAAEDNLNISLTWQSSTSAPDEYQGRSLPTRSSTLTVFALIAKHDPNNLIFDWYLDRNYMKYASGQGRDTFSFVITEWHGYDHTVRVKISNKDESVSGYASITIDVHEPKVYIFLENNFNKEYSLKPGSEQTFTSIPYFFNTYSMDSLQYKWYFNNREVENTGALSRPDKFSLKINSGSKAMRKKLGILITNPNNLIERAVREIKVFIK